MSVTDYLVSHTLNNLKDKHGVIASPDMSGHRLVLCYDELFSRIGDPIADECNGLVIKHTNSTLAEALKKGDKAAFNMLVGESKAIAVPPPREYDITCEDDIEWYSDKLYITEKMHGIQYTLYYDGKWRYATKHEPTATNFIPLSIGKTPAISIFTTFLQKQEEKPEPIHKLMPFIEPGKTYTFIVTSPLFNEKVKYSNHTITLIAAHDGNDWMDIKQFNLGDRVVLPKEYTKKMLFDKLVGEEVETIKHGLMYESVVRYVERQPVGSFGGFIINDGSKHLHRVLPAKLQSNKNVRATKFTPKVLLSNIILGTITDIAPLLDDSVWEVAADLLERYDDFCAEIDAAHTKYVTSSKESGRSLKCIYYANGESDVEFCFKRDNTHSCCADMLKHMLRKKELHDNQLDELLKQLNSMTVVSSTNGRKTFQRVTSAPKKRVGIDLSCPTVYIRGR